MSSRFEITCCDDVVAITAPGGVTDSFSRSGTSTDRFGYGAIRQLLTDIAALTSERDQLRARLADLERASIAPVAYEYAHPYFGGGEIWRAEQRWNGHTSDKARALYAAPPIPAGLVELREPSDDGCRDIWRRAKENEGDGSKVCAGRAMFNAVSKWLKGEL